MSSLVVAKTVCCIITCHGASAEHLATFTQHLSKSKNIEFQIYASEHASQKFKDRGIEIKRSFSTDTEEQTALAEQIAKVCSIASLVIVDVGDSFVLKVQKALAPDVFCFAYYDNPEPYVPGGYSKVASQVMLAADGILFANSKLPNTAIFEEPGKEIDFGSRKKIGIGYYPMDQAETIAKRRAKEHASMRQQFFLENDVIEEDQKVMVYFGGNNDVYFNQAFPAFLSLLEEGILQSDLSHLIFVLQQHPQAKGKNLDGNMVSDWLSRHGKSAHAPKIFISKQSPNDIQVIADGALYNQTSMGPQFIIGNIPTLHIGPAIFQDILVRDHLISSITKVDEFLNAMKDLAQQKKEIPREVILEGLGIKENWPQILEAALLETALKV